MKKLMIAAAIVCAAAVSQAALANWKVTAGNTFDGTGSQEDAALYSGAAYLFDAGLVSQSAVYDIIAGGGTISDSTTGYIIGITFTEGSLVNQTFSYKEQGSGSSTFFAVIVQDDQVYFSNEKAQTAGTSATAKTIALGSQDNESSTFSHLAPSGSGFAGAGYWSTVPEPTSGLLLLLGVAGLALRRRRA